MKVLIPIDGSKAANRAVDHVIASVAWLKEIPQVCLLNVQWKLASGNVKLFISQDTINDYYREQGMAALAEARARLDAAGLAYNYHISVGTPAEAIVQYAQEKQVDQIVISAHGQDTLSDLLLGSVASKVAHLARIPVLLVK
ncbi:TRAP-T-associated universal stress protein TeaD [Sideroxyarcus emersonii]|uniref:TRAP-T-associated universal stress protein TeaD n=1 Tax=Sideroxyarcus emersonii TaxID=2764705 RepID=A0AAN1X825_9PROT|nr:universal stress protein [Sideroxyarcus emersonii]BCK86652.1 TRAP-T-associated universal stress protein TeaD [Sideroxyarcus emersonii]